MAEQFFSGGEQLADALARAILRMPDKAAAGLTAIAEEVMGDSKEHYVPVRDGILRSSGYVNDPVVRGRETSVEMGYGGPAAPYAADQHENLEYSHTVGEAKYLEKPLVQHQPRMAQTLASHLDLDDLTT